MTKWRQRFGDDGIKELLKESIHLALRKKLITRKQFKSVYVGTTVQEKNITYPTDAKLYHKMRSKLVKFAKKAGVKLRQSFERLSGKALFIVKNSKAF